MKKSKGIGSYLGHVKRAVGKGPTPDTIWLPKSECKRMCEGETNTRPDILKILNDESIPETAWLEISREKK